MPSRRPLQFVLVMLLSLWLSVGAWAQEEPVPAVPVNVPDAELSDPPDEIIYGSATAPASEPWAATSQAVETEPAKPTASVAYIRMTGPVLESPPLFSLLGEGPGMTVRDWLHRLAKARNDPQIAAVALELDNPRLSWTAAQELADGIRRLDEVKPVYTHVVCGGIPQYLLASAGRHVSMEPAGELAVVGLAAEMTFFRGSMQLLGIKPQMIQVGRFKGAAEPLENDKPSEETIQMHNWLLDDLYDQLCQQIVTQRRLGMEAVKAAIDDGPLMGEAAIKHKFADELTSIVDWRDRLVQLAGQDGKADVKFLDGYGKKQTPQLDLSNPFALLGLLSGTPRQPTSSPTIAIIHAQGVIVSGKGGEDFFGQRSIGARTMAQCFEEARNDPNIKAVVFRIDSPGGSALASEQIFQSVAKCAKSKPVIVSIASMGASGGYYIACGGQTILADPAALVGSIGVVSGKLAIQGLMEKVGVSTYEIQRGKNAGLNLSRPWTQREQEVMRQQAERIYSLFVERVKGARPAVAEVDAVAQGRVFTARQALSNGLVDEIGGMKEAVAKAEKLAGVRGAFYLSLPRPMGLAELLSGDEDAPDTRMPLGADASDMLLVRTLRSQPGLAYMMSLMALMRDETTLMAMPYYLQVK